MSPFSLVLLLLAVNQATAQSGSGIEEISLEAWIIVGALVIGIVGVVAIAWVIAIVCICRTYCIFRKRRKRTRYLSRLEERYGRQPHAVTSAELRAVSLSNHDYHQVSPRRQRGGQIRSTLRQVEPHSSTGLESPSSYSDYRRPTAPLNTSSNSSGVIQRSNEVSISGILRSGSNSSMGRSDSNPRGIGISKSTSSGIGMMRSSSNSGGMEVSVLNPTRSTLGSDHSSTGTEIMKSASHSHGIETRQSTSTGILKSSSSHTRGFPTPQQPPHSPAARVVLGVQRSHLQCLSEVEEMDVRQDLSGEGLVPRYNQLFPGIEEQNMPTSDQRRNRTTSPFTFSSERRVGGRELDRKLQFNQLSSWPNFR